MTREEILAMEAGGELDKSVAESIFGFQVKAWETFRDKPIYHFRVPSQYGEIWEHLQKYSTDPTTAWLVLEKMIELGLFPDIDYLRSDHGQGRWRCIIRTGVPCIHYIDVRRGAPEAICKAALLAKLEVVGDDCT